MITRRLSLRVLLAVCVGIAIGLGLFRIFVLGPVIARADAERVLLESGAQITKENTKHFLADPRWPGKRTPPEQPAPSRLEQALSQLTGRDIDLRHVSEISFVTAHRFPTDQDADAIMCFPEVEKLDLTMIEKTDLPGGGTRNRNLGSQEITDLGIAKIATLPGLRELVLGDANVSDDAFDALSSSKSLELFGVQNSKITDAGLVKLTLIPSLKALYVANNKRLTLEGVRDFRSKRPEVYIRSNYWVEVGTGTEPNR